jgi:hypothetical protein
MNSLAVVAITLFASHLSPASPTEEARIKLELTSQFRTLRIGQQMAITLKIAGPDVHALVEGTEGLTSPPPWPSAFTYNFDFKPTREGVFNLGPYALTFNGQALTSNAIKVTVLPKWDGPYGTFFRMDKTTMVLGEDVELVAETWQQQDASKTFLRPKPSDSFSLSVGQNTSSISLSDGKTSSYYARVTWFLTPKAAGILKITRDSFVDFPAGVEPPNLSVEVTQPEQP